MPIKLQLPSLTELTPKITVIGVGGAGGNAINNMIAQGLDGVDFVAANTDAQALLSSSAELRIQLGATLTEGLGAGAKPDVGEAAAEEALEDIRAAIVGSHMVFIAAGMGGGTGTGAASVIARTAKEQGILTVGVVTKPFAFEGSRRMRMAEAGIEAMRRYVDTLIVIPNQNLFRIANEKTTFAEAFRLADQVLHSGIACVTDLVVREGLINLDFADVRTVLAGMGTAMMGTGEAEGPDRALEAAELAINNPLLDDVSLQGAKGLLISISGDRGLTLFEVDAAASRIREEVDPEANIIVGATFDDTLDQRVRVSIVASGLVGAKDYAAPPLEPARRPAESLARQLSAVQSRAEISDRQAPMQLAAAAEPEWLEPGDGVIELPPARVEPEYEPRRESAMERLRPTHGIAFEALPPAEIRRPVPRMPELAEFPPVAQRDYEAKRGKVSDPAEPVEKKRGFFSRWTGRSAVGSSDSQASRDAPSARSDHGQRRRDPNQGSNAARSGFVGESRSSTDRHVDGPEPATPDARIRSNK